MRTICLEIFAKLDLFVIMSQMGIAYPAMQIFLTFLTFINFASHTKSEEKANEKNVSE